MKVGGASCDAHSFVPPVGGTHEVCVRLMWVLATASTSEDYALACNARA